MLSRLASALRAWLGHRWLPAHLALLAALLLTPAIGLGWQVDDWAHRMIMLGVGGVETAPLDVFASLPGDPAFNRRYLDLGVLPWWTPPDFKLSFCRPLSALSMWLDYRLWPERPELMHLHSLAWLAATVAAATLVYRRLLPGWAGGLAALLFAVDEAHAVPAAWLANRNALLATCFGLLALAAHDRWRREGWRPGALWGPLLLVLGLLSGETALGAVGFFAAHALFVDQGPLRRRLAGLLPAGAALAAWIAYYRIQGFGARGSGLYLDPLGDPAAFAAALARRGPLLLLGQWSPVPADLGILGPGLLAASWALIVVLALLLAPLLRGDRTARFFALGMLLALVPSAATFPSNRLLFFVGFGGMGLLAQFLAGVWQGAPWRPRTLAWRLPAAVVGFLLALAHLVFAPVATALTPRAVRATWETAMATAASAPADPAIARQDLVVVNAPDYLTAVSNIAPLQVLRGRPVPRRVQALRAAPVPVVISRLDERTLRVRLGGSLFSGTLGSLFHGGEPLGPGQVARLPRFAVEVRAVDGAGEPRELLFRFDRPLEDPSLRWVVSYGGPYEPFMPPPPGRSVALPAPVDPFLRAFGGGSR